AVGRLLLLGAIPESVSAPDSRVAADRRQRRTACRHARGTRSAGSPRAARHSPGLGSRELCDRAEDIPMAVTDLLLVDQTEVAQLLPMGECIDVMAQALASLARGQAQLPLRSILWLPERIGAFALMPGALHEDKVVGAKVVTFFYGNQGTDLDAHQGAVLLFEAERGRLLAVIDATSITAIRTAAVSGVATRLLAREDASELALIGSGVPSRTHLEAMRIAGPIRKARVGSKDFASARRFAEREPDGQAVEIEPVRTARDAVRGAAIVCTVTTSLEPVVLGDWLEP